MTAQDIFKLAAAYMQKTTSPFDPDKVKQTAQSSFIAGFTVAQGLWQAEFDRLQADGNKPTATPPPVSILKP